ncbi:MAG: dihydropteroate synthase [Alphaproteobacteria bacterium]|nr:dihydropteroate synthase [Alphaproteobacteria bacterium]
MTVQLIDLRPSETASIYLRPLCGPLGLGRPAAWLAGAWAGFDTLQVILRDGGATATAEGSVADIRRWIAGLGADQRARLEAVFARLIEPRPAFAGLELDHPRIMGVLNVTPDSFSDGGDYASTEAAIARAHEQCAGGAAILDIGGESTRPGSDPVAEEEELGRVLPVIEAVAGAGLGASISIDTRKAAVMERAVAAGAAIINDISALTGDPRALGVAAELGVHVVLMHCQGEPKTMQAAPAYDHPPAEVFDYLEARIAACEAAGIPRSRIAVDPGIGFGKALDHNLALLTHLSLLHGLGCPVLLGVSRKTVIGKISGEDRPKARLPGSLAAMLAGLDQGVQMVRVHDTAETRQAIAVWRALRGAA